MKILHTSDLHLGIKLNQFSLIEDQAYILEEIIKIAVSKGVDGVVIAGDIYDKSIPPAEAVKLFDRFLVKLSKAKIPVYIIGGNHDSQDRLSFARELIEESMIYISPIYNGNLVPLKLNDEFGTLNLYMLPYVKPIHVRQYFSDESDDSIDDYNSAIKVIIESLNLNLEERNVMITHQFIAGALQSDSEEYVVGNLNQVDARLFEDFDATMLGHLHRPQKIERDNIQYSGSPLKYSFSEVNNKKSVIIWDFKEKGNTTFELIRLNPIRDLKEIEGSFWEITSPDSVSDESKDNFMRVTLTDENEIPNAMARLRTIYPNILRLDYKSQKPLESDFESHSFEAEKSPMDIFSNFFEKQNGLPISDEAKAIMKDIFDEVWRNEE